MLTERKHILNTRTAILLGAPLLTVLLLIPMYLRYSWSQPGEQLSAALSEAARERAWVALANQSASLEEKTRQVAEMGLIDLVSELRSHLKEVRVQLQLQNEVLREHGNQIQGVKQTLASSLNPGTLNPGKAIPRLDTSLPILESRANGSDSLEENCPDDPSGQSVRGTLRWAQTNGTFLLATCLMGRMSNRLRCISKYMLAATLLNRTLVVPMEDLNEARPGGGQTGKIQGYDFSLIFNVTYTQACLGRNSVWSLAQYLQRKKTREMTVSQLACWAPKCMFPGKVPPALGTLKFPPRSMWANVRVGPPEQQAADQMSMAQFVKVFSRFAEDEVLCLGDIDYMDFSDQPPGLRIGLATGWATECGLLMKPHDVLMDTAEGFISSYTGPRFAAAHLRRFDFYRYCVKAGRCKYLSIREVAICLRQKMSSAGLTVLFLATDAEKEEVDFLQQLLKAPNSGLLPITITTMPPPKGRMWAESLIRLKLDSSQLAVATIEKLICSKATRFYGTLLSSFSGHIHALRRGYGVPHCRDSEVCEGVSLEEG